MRRRAAIAGLSATLLAGLIGCAEGSDPPSAASPTAAKPTVRVEVENGTVVSGKGRHEVALGSEVVIEIMMEAADEVHVHGYDETVATQPGKAARLTFVADIPGVFEVELHEAGTVLCELQVQ